MYKGNKLDKLISLIFIAGLIAAWVGGIDLVSARAGWGVFAMGVAAMLATLFVSHKHAASLWFWIWLVAGIGYFFWRAVVAGPAGLASQDLILIMTFAVVYQGAARGSVVFPKSLAVGLILVCLGHLCFVTIQLTSTATTGAYLFSPRGVNSGVATGFYEHYNYFAGFANAAFFVFLTLALLAPIAKFWRIVHAIMAVLILAAIWMSGSRGGWLSIVAGGTIWFICYCALLKWRSSPKLPAVILSGTIAIVVAIASSYAVIQMKAKNRFGDRSDKPKQTELTHVNDGGRLGFQSIATDLFLESPAIGLGPRVFSYRAIEDWDAEEMWINTPNPEFVHNEYLQTLADYGLVGFLIALVGIAAHLIHGGLGVFESKNPRDDISFDSALKLGAIGGLVAILAQCFVSFLNHVPANVAMFALLLGLLARRPGTSLRSNNKLACAGISILTLTISGAAIYSGFFLSKAAHQTWKAEKVATNAPEPEQALSAIREIKKAGVTIRDTTYLNRAGQLAMAFAQTAANQKLDELSTQFSREAEDAFLKALELNPHSQMALCGLPRVLDAQGRYAEAQKHHEHAVKKLWSREPQLSPLYFAGRSDFQHGYALLLEQKETEGRRLIRQGAERILRHREMVRWIKPDEDEVRMVDLSKSWLAVLDGENLYKEGDRLWKKRQAEKGMAFMLEAEKRFREGRQLLTSKSVWATQWTDLQKALRILRSALIQPAELTPEEIAGIANPGVGNEER